MHGSCEILDTDKMESPALFSFKELYKSALALHYEKDYPQVKTKEREPAMEDFVFCLELTENCTSKRMWAW